MLFLLAAFSLVGAATWWLRVRRRPARSAPEPRGVAHDVLRAARRFGFRWSPAANPAETIEDPKIVVGALAVGFLELDVYPTPGQNDALVRGLGEELLLSPRDAEDLAILGRWIIRECGGAEAAVNPLTRTLYRLSHQSYFQALMGTASAIARFGDGTLSSRQKAALEDIQRGLGVSFGGDAPPA